MSYDDYGFSSREQQRLAEKYVDAKAVNNFPQDQRGNIVEFEDGSEWLIFDSYDEAESQCIDYVEEMLDEEPETFSRDWLRHHTTLSETDRRVIANDMVGEYPSDIRDEDDGRRLAEEADLDDEFEDLKEKIDEYEDLDKDTSALEDKLEILLDRAEEIVQEKMYDDYYDRLDDPYQFFVEDEGMYSPRDFWEKFGYAIDIKEAAEDAVNIDGVAHFFASYDGNQVDLDDGSVMYRVN